MMEEKSADERHDSLDLTRNESHGSRPPLYESPRPSSGTARSPRPSNGSRHLPRLPNSSGHELHGRAAAANPSDQHTAEHLQVQRHSLGPRAREDPCAGNRTARHARDGKARVFEGLDSPAASVTAPIQKEPKPSQMQDATPTSSWPNIAWLL
ncbi:hypothetical protein FOMPIDRAFT_98295, partial [Fomitopsis schrenkii]